MTSNSTRPVRVAIVGTGGIGKLHAELASSHAAVELVAISSLDDDASELSERLGTTLERDYRDVVTHRPEAVIIATPNQTHLEMGVFFANNNVHLLVEKPIAENLRDARALCNAADQAGVQILVGHHRRHHNLVRATKKFVDGNLGTLIATNTLVAMQKPNSYYEVDWRRGESAGPLLVNLIHEVDLLRAVCGEIVAVQAASTKRNRDFAFDDTAAVLLHYANGAFGTLVLSESAASPWSWEASVSDGLSFFNAGQDHAKFIGTEASLSFPSLTTWAYNKTDGEPGWESPLHSSVLSLERNNPYVDQIQNLADVTRLFDLPLVSGRDGFRSLAVVDAVITAASSGKLIEIDKLLADS